MRPDSQPIGLVNQQIDPLPPLQHPLDILRHNPLHIIDIRLHVADRILLAPLRRPVTDHQTLQLRVKIRGAVRWQAGEICRFWVIAREELFLDLDQVAKGDAPPEVAGGDDEVGEAAGGGVSGWMVRGGVGDVVDEVLVMGVRQFLRGAVVDLGQDEGSE